MIRKATESDCKNLAALAIQVWLNTYAREGINQIVSDHVLTTFNEQHFKDQLAQEGFSVYVYCDEQNLLGFIAIDLLSQWGSSEHGFEIATLYVQNRQQGRGIGRALLNFVGSQFAPCYWLTTWAHNVEGLSFYQHLGFEDIGVSYFELAGEQHENRVLAYRAS